MKGLLYKDYLLNNGKYYVGAIILQIILVITIAINCKSNPENELGMVYLFATLALVFPMLVICLLVEFLLKNDSIRQVEYYISTPINKSTYVLSKYIYILVALAAFSLIVIPEYFGIKGLLEFSNSKKLYKSVCDLIPIIIGMAFVTTSIELPFYFGLGIEKGRAIKIGLTFLLLFGFMAYIFFGDLDLIRNMNATKLLEMIIGDKSNMIYVQIGTPILGLAMFAVSFLISNKLYNVEK